MLAGSACVRWSPKGDMLATACHAGFPKVIDFKTENIIYSGNIPDESKIIWNAWDLISFFNYLGMVGLAMSVCFIWPIKRT